jgi:arginine:pyruvate transaminase
MMQYADVTTRLAGLGSDKWVLSAAANARIRAGEAIINLTIGEPDLPTPAAQGAPAIRTDAASRHC